MKIIFQTPGLIDLRAILIMGLNSKPVVTSPIGYFGTGLKYAIAVLMREQQQIQMVIGRDTYNFYTKPATFREKDFQFIYMKKASLLGKEIRLPFTTELGKNWKMWQAFRELFSNTLDENGVTYPGNKIIPELEGDWSYILVEGEAFAQEYEQRWSNFLEEGVTQGKEYGVQCIPNRPSKYIYYRGIRIRDLEKPSLHTYNIISKISLTEDRTANSMWEVHNQIGHFIASSDNEDLIQTALDADEKYFESTLNFENMWQSPSKEFIYIGAGSANRTARKLIRQKERASHSQHRTKHFTELLCECITDNDWETFKQIAEENSEELYKLLNGLRPAGTDPEAELITVEGSHDTGATATIEDEIPF